MRSIAIVVSDVLANETEQMSFTQYDDVVEKLATQDPDASFGESVLPGRPRRDPNLLDAQVVDARVEEVGTQGGQEIDRDRTREMIADESLPDCDGGRRGRPAGLGMYLATVSLETS